MAKVYAVSKNQTHSFTKESVKSIKLIAGEGVEGDAHRGATVKHRSRVKVDPMQPNLRQAHIIHLELLEELRGRKFNVIPGSLGENITTTSLDLLSLPTNTILKIGEEALVKVTGLRNPCKQLDDYQKGLTAAVLGRDSKGSLIRKTGIMGIVLHGGVVSEDDEIMAVYPEKPFLPLKPV